MSDCLWPPGLQPTGLLCPPGISQLRTLQWVAVLPSRAVTRAACKRYVTCLPPQWWPAWTQAWWETCQAPAPEPPRGFWVWSVVYQYRCKRGFYLLGSSALTCMENGLWDRSLPKCLGEWGSSGLSCRRALKEHWSPLRRDIVSHTFCIISG